MFLPLMKKALVEGNRRQMSKLVPLPPSCVLGPRGKNLFKRANKNSCLSGAILPPMEILLPTLNKESVPDENPGHATADQHNFKLNSLLANVYKI
jgi:hypothetical protein